MNDEDIEEIIDKAIADFKEIKKISRSDEE